MLKKKSFRQSTGDGIFDLCNHLFIILFSILVAYPIIYVISSSFSNPVAIVSGKVWLFPVDFTLDGYKATFVYPRIWTGYGNSFFYAGVGTMINIVLTIMAAYPLSRKDFTGGGVIMILFVITMWFNGGLIPNYVLVRELGLIDTRWALIIPSALSVYNLILARTYFKMQIPNELFESAKLDGCDDYKFLLKIVIPLSAPIIAVIALFYAVGHWNSYFSAFLYLSKRDLYPIQLILREVLTLNQVNSMEAVMDHASTDEKLYFTTLLKYSIIIVSSLPVIIAYPFAQKYFVKGVMIGAIKG